MAVCVKIKRKKKQVCVGSLNRRVEIYQRIIKAPFNPTNEFTNYDDEFSLLRTVWALIQTPKGTNVFDQVERSESKVTHYFYIAYFDGLTQENWIVYKNNRYDILDVINLEEQNLYYRLDCFFRGSVGKDASKA